MKTLKIFLLFIVFINISLFADKKVHENILMQKNIQYYLEIRAKNAEIEVFINGVEIYSDYGLGNIFIDYPVNDYIRTGKNEVKVKLIAEKDVSYIIKDKAEVEVNLKVKNFKTKENYVISTLKYTHNNEDKTIGSSLEGKYNSLKDFVMDQEGNVEVNAPEIENNPIRFGEKNGGLIVSQNVYFETAYPKWKFFDSEDIIEKRMELYTVDELDKIKERSDIKELYNIYTKIHTALKNKKPERILDLFEERNNELDIAWGKESGFMKVDNLVSIKEEIDNLDKELVEFNHKDMAFFIEDNLKLIHIPAIGWNKKDGGSVDLNLKFRRENGKWILTR
ncbi:MAG: hypothetical protein MJK08_11300 [Campylobacterales bacterium]|nr:hypothetical protein [Campylobacterales bacterium]